MIILIAPRVFLMQSTFGNSSILACGNMSRKVLSKFLLTALGLAPLTNISIITFTSTNGHTFLLLESNSLFIIISLSSSSLIYKCDSNCKMSFSSVIISIFFLIFCMLSIKHALDILNFRASAFAPAFNALTRFS